MREFYEAEAGTPVPELCRSYGMSSASFYKRRASDGKLRVMVKDAKTGEQRSFIASFPFDA